MKTRYLCLSLVLGFLFFSLDIYSQQGRRNGMGANKQKIEAHKIAYITEKLDLTPEEAEKFWPVYNAHNKKVESERKEMREKFDFSNEKLEDLSNEEALEFIDSRLIHEQTLLNITKEFNEELKKVISPQKIIQLIRAEKEFREKLIRQVAGRRGPQEGRR